jgi:hypothetical protein
MYIQLDLELIFQKEKEKGRPPNFHALWSEDVHLKKHL